MAFVNIGIKGLEETNRMLRKIDVNVRKEIRAEVGFAADEIVNLIKRDAPVDRARLKNSVSKRLTGELKAEIIAQSNHAPYMEFGTKSKFKAPNGLEGYAGQFRGSTGISDVDPLEALTRWVRRKGLADTYSTRKYDVNTRSGVRRSRGKAYKKRESTIAFLILRKIKKVGVTPHPFFFTNKSGVDRMKQARDIFIDRLTKALKRVTK